MNSPGKMTETKGESGDCGPSADAAVVVGNEVCGDDDAAAGLMDTDDAGDIAFLKSFSQGLVLCAAKFEGKHQWHPVCRHRDIVCGDVLVARNAFYKRLKEQQQAAAAQYGAPLLIVLDGFELCYISDWCLQINLPRSELRRLQIALFCYRNDLLEQLLHTGTKLFRVSRKEKFSQPPRAPVSQRPQRSAYQQACRRMRNQR
jgi:hypothetical protein